VNQLKEIFFDLETKRWSTEVEGGWSNIPVFGLSVGVTCWDDSNIFQTWLENDAMELVKELERADKIIGFNITGFDYEVLSAYVPNVHELLDRKSFDILADLEGRLGFRVSLENICSATLGKSKIGSGKDAVEWFRQGQIEKVVLYCQRDVELTRDIYRYGQEHGLIYYPRFGQPVAIPVDWGA
jgi:DEAD/DEAH box helicase domain-containing protein